MRTVRICIGLLVRLATALGTVAHAFTTATTPTACVPSACHGLVDRTTSKSHTRPCGGLGIAVRKKGVDDTRSDAQDDGAAVLLALPRRRFLSFVVLGSTTTAVLPLLAVASAKDLKEDYRQGTAALSEMDDQAPVPREAYQKLNSGVIYADLRTGSAGAEVRPGSRINLQWVLRKSNGYFVDSSERNDSVPFIFTVGDGTAIAGLDEGVRGMKVGGVRRILIPPSLAYVQGLDDGKPGPLPIGFGPRQQMRRVQEVRKDVPGEYVYLEVQLTRMR